MALKPLYQYAFDKEKRQSTLAIAEAKGRAASV